MSAHVCRLACGANVMPPVTALQPRAALPPLAPPPTYDATFDRSWSIRAYDVFVRPLVPGDSSG